MLLGSPAVLVLRSLDLILFAMPRLDQTASRQAGRPGTSSQGIRGGTRLGIFRSSELLGLADPLILMDF